MKADVPNVKVARFDSSMNIAYFARSVEGRNGNKEGNVDLIQRYKYTDRDLVSLHRFGDGIVSRNVKSPLDRSFR